MAYGDGTWHQYPWSSNVTYDDQTSYTWGYSTSSGAYVYPQVYPAPQTWAEEKIEKVESAMEWLRRRVTEITDLAYAT